MVPHDIQQALKYSNQIMAIDAGREVFTGTLEEILKNGTLKKVFHVEVKRVEYPFAM